MKLTGIEIRNFRSIGERGVMLSPLKKCNIIIGQNNSGKSNVLRALKFISDFSMEKNNNLTILDKYMRSHTNDFMFNFLYDFDDIENVFVNNYYALTNSKKFLIEFKWDNNHANIVKYSLNNINEDQKFKLELFVKKICNISFPGPPSFSQLRKVINQERTHIYNSYFDKLPQMNIIPEFRQIREGKVYTHDGQFLINLLGSYQHPKIGSDEDREKFNKIEMFLKTLLKLPDAHLEVSTENPQIIINNNGLRLPLSSYGTGVHELIIIITAILSKENEIFSLEEPEIHLHPRLQKELIEFLVNETSNQYFITTHSPALINMMSENNDVQIFHLKNNEEGTYGGPIGNTNSAVQAIRDLGFFASDLLQTNSIIWVEGASDRIYINKWLSILAPDLREGIDFSYMYYSSLPNLSFDNELYLDDFVNVFKFNSNAILVIDSDKKNPEAELKKTAQKMIEQCEKFDVLYWVTDGKEIENYLSSNTIKKAFQDMQSIDVNLSISEFTDFEKTINRKIVAAGGTEIYYSKGKTNYARKFTQYIVEDDISEKLRVHLNAIIDKIRDWKN